MTSRVSYLGARGPVCEGSWGWSRATSELVGGSGPEGHGRREQFISDAARAPKRVYTRNYTPSKAGKRKRDLQSVRRCRWKSH